jgi:hypothetical protein
MADLASRGRNLLVVVALGTFHAAALIVALVLVLYTTGALPSLLSSLNTIAGLALFSALWLTTVWSAHRTLRGAFTETLRTSLSIPAMIERATWNGGLNGVAFLVFVGVILAISSALNGSLGILVFGTLFFATVGAVAAFLLGCLFGLLFVAIDIVLVTATRAILDEYESRP